MTPPTTRSEAPWLRVTEVAELLGVSPNTVRRWTDSGRLVARRSPGGHRRYLLDDVLAFAALNEADGASPGDLATLRREQQAAREALAATEALLPFLASAPEEVPQRAAAVVCETTAAARCEVYVLDEAGAHRVASHETGRGEDSRPRVVRDLGQWLPCPLDPARVVVLHAGGERADRRQDDALRRRGCRTLAVATLSGDDGGPAGWLEVTDSEVRDLAAHEALLSAAARCCAAALPLARQRARLARHDRTVRELVTLSHSVAESRDAERFALALADRLLAATGADYVDLWRVDGGTVRRIAGRDREGWTSQRVGATLDLGAFPVMRAVVRDLEPLVIRDLRDPRLTQAEVQRYHEWGYASSVSMPLVAGGRLVGVVELYDDAERDWEPELPLLTGICQLVASLFDKAVLLAESEERARQQADLARLATTLAGAEDLTAMAAEAAARLREMAACVDCDIWWVEEGVMRCLASVDEHGVDASVQGKRFEIERFPLSARALETRQPVVAPSPDDPGLTDAEREDLAEFGFVSNLVLPLVSQDEVIGFIDLFDRRERDFAAELDLLVAASRTVADALRTADLLARLRTTNAALRELVDLADRLAEAGRPGELAHLVAERLRLALGAEDCDVWQVDGAVLRCLCSIDSRGVDEDEVGSERRLDEYLSAVDAVARNEPLVIGDLEAAGLSDDEMAHYRRWGYRSMVSVPLVSAGRPVGLIDVFDTRPRDYSGHLDFIRGVGRLLAGAFERALLLQRLETTVRDLRQLVEAGAEFGATLDTATVVDRVARRIHEVSAADMCDLYRLVGDEVETVISLGVDDGEGDVGARYPLNDYTTYLEALRTQRPVLRTDLLADPGATAAERADAERWGYRASLDVPLVSQGRVIGFVTLMNRECRDFAHLDLVLGLAQLAGQALANAALYEEQQRTAAEASLLNDIARAAATSLDLDEIATAAVRELRRRVTFARYALLLVEDGAVAQVVAASGHQHELAALRLADLAPGFIERLAEERVMVVRPGEDGPLPASHPLLAGVAALAVVALPGDRGLTGALALVGERPDAFDDVDRRLLERVGVHLALAVRNARLYEEIKGLHLANLKALTSALNAKDYYTLGHAARVAAYAVMLARELGWPEDELPLLQEAAYLHDIGKIGISDRVLLKSGRLNDQEWLQMREHPGISADIIRPLFPGELVAGVRHHHERYGGGGYPDGLAGTDIPPVARLLAVVDAYDAMSCRRPYKSALDYTECLAELERCRGEQFDPAMVDAFLRVLERVARRRAEARAVAAEAAARIPADLHASIRSREDEQDEAYRAVAALLREVRDAHPGTRFLTTHVRLRSGFAIGVDPEEDEALRSHFGEPIFADDELVALFEGGQVEANTVYADPYGVWVTGYAPLRGDDGHVVAVVAADLPALPDAAQDLLPADRGHDFASILRGAAVRLSRAEIDAITDALTGLYNHRYLHERLDEELQRAAELGQELHVLFLDLDHFKAYNDTHGHSAGDAVLREVAHRIEQAVRNVDVAARYGGEEFVVVLVDTDLEAALSVAERIRERVRGAGFSAAGEPLTVSIGVAGFPRDAQGREALLDKADWAMYLAKRRGRDQVAAFRDGTRPDETPRG